MTRNVADYWSDSEGEFNFRVMDFQNGKVIAHTEQGYSNLADAQAAMARLGVAPEDMRRIDHP